MLEKNGETHERNLPGSCLVGIDMFARLTFAPPVFGGEGTPRVKTEPFVGSDAKTELSGAKTGTKGTRWSLLAIELGWALCWTPKDRLGSFCRTGSPHLEAQGSRFPFGSTHLPKGGSNPI